MKYGVFFALIMAMGCASLHDYSRSTPALSSLAASIQLESASQVHTLRWNPANCDCPEWELKLSDRWLRVSVEVGEADVEEALETAKNVHAFDVEGKLSPTPYRCGPTLLCGTLRGARLVPSTEAIP